MRGCVLQANITIFVINAYAGRLQTGKQSVGRYCLSYYLPKIVRRYENSFKRLLEYSLLAVSFQIQKTYLLRKEYFHRQFKYLFCKCEVVAYWVCHIINEQANIDSVCLCRTMLFLMTSSKSSCPTRYS